MVQHKNNLEANARLVRCFKTLGDENRYYILKLLTDSNLCVGALARILNISKPAVSQHLKLLREAGLVKGEKIGYWTHYRVEKEVLHKTCQALKEMAETDRSKTSHNTYMCLRDDDIANTAERRALQMCENCCEQPEKLRNKPEKCTPEQIKECHGDEQNHPCECEKKE